MDKDSRKKTPAFIWDLDGTLLDSYAVIVPSLQAACGAFGVRADKNDIYSQVITDSVAGFLKKTEEASGVPFDALMERYRAISEGSLSAIRPTGNAAEILGFLRDRGIPSYVFTHRGSSTEAVLKNTGLFGFFDEIVTGTDGFARKPDPSALLYLIRKHGLDRSRTYYVGDRALDIACADRAGVRSVLYLPAGSPAKATGRETHIVGDLREIAELL